MLKKNIAVIYRLAFILFSIWAIFESAAFRIQNLPVKLLDFTVFSDAICMLCIVIVLAVTLRRTIGQGLRTFKTGCTFLALLALAANLPMLFSVESNSWILKILLPLMMLLDYLFFDNKGKIKPWQALLWLLAAAGMAWLLYVIADKFLNLPASLDLLGLFSDRDSLTSLLLNALLLSGILFILDRLFSGGLFKDFKSIFALLFRLIFLLLEIWAFVRLSDLNLRTFFHALRYYENLVNFLCFLCVGAVLIYNTLRFKASAKGSYVFSRIKSFFTVCIVFAFVVYHFYVRGGYIPDSVAIVLYYIAPLMMLADWLFFDTCSHIRPYDPLIWMAFPLAYFILTLLLKQLKVVILYPILHSYVQIGIFAVGLLALGYIFYFIDRIIKRR